MNWLEIILSIITTISTSGFLVALATLRAKKRKEDAEAGKTELDLRNLQHQAEIELDRDKAAQIIELVKEAQGLRAKIKQLLEEQIQFELKIADLTKRALIAEEKYNNARCDCFACIHRIPPLG